MPKSFRRLFKDELRSFGRQAKRQIRRELTRFPRRGRSMFDMFMDEITGAPRRRR